MGKATTGPSQSFQKNKDDRKKNDNGCKKRYNSEKCKIHIISATTNMPN